MAVFTSNGNRVTRAAFPAVPIEDAPLRVTEDLYDTVLSGHGAADPRPEGSVKRLLARAGTVLSPRQIDALFPRATISGVTPTTVPATTSVQVTLRGTNLDGVTAVRVGGTNAGDVIVRSRTELTFQTPSGTAGQKEITLVDDSGETTVPNVITYA